MSRFPRILIQIVLVFLLIVAGATGILFYTFSGGPVSNDRLRAQVEGQLSSFLGPDLDMRMDKTSLALGAGGLLSLEANGVTVLRDGSTNLGVADRVQVKVKPLPLLRGEIVAESLTVDGAKIALLPVLPDLAVTQNEANFALDWTGQVDLKRSLSTLGRTIGEMATAIANAGLDRISFRDVRLVGFDQLGLRMQRARFRQLIIERDANFQNGLLVHGQLISDHNTIMLKGSWQPNKDDNVFDLTLTGFDMQDVLVAPESPSSGYLRMDSPIAIRLRAPFDAAFAPMIATIKISVGAGRFELGDAIRTSLSSADINLALLPEKNQIELEPSPVRFEKTEATLLGGVRFADEAGTRPLFELLANDVTAYSMKSASQGAPGAMQISGSIDRSGKQILAETLLLKTPSGEMSGDGLLDFSQANARLRLNLGVKRMDVAHFKQFWPAIVATGAHDWADEGISGGLVRNAKMSMQLPVSDLWNDKQLTSKHLTATIPIEGATVKTTGSLPPVSDAIGEVGVSGMVTSIQLSDGKLNSGVTGSVKVDTGSLVLRAGEEGSLPADLALKLSGDASAIAQLGKLPPLDFTTRLGLNPADLKGSVSAGITTSFDVLKDFDPTASRWAASVQIKNGSSTSAVAGRKVSDADLVIEASPSAANITGSATVDGLPARLALIEPLSGDSQRQRTLTLTLDDAARKRAGIDTGGILTGAVGVTLSSDGGDGQLVEADLTAARLDLPWIGWTKGKGIRGTAKFVLRSAGKTTRLENFSLEGKGFGARGTIVLDSGGLLEANLKKVVLNRTDDFDVSANRTRRGYKVAVSARSYDGRAIVQKFLDNQRTNPKGGKTVSIAGSIGKLIGFNGAVLTSVSLDFVQTGSRVVRAQVKSFAAGSAVTNFSLQPVKGGVETNIYSENAGAVLGFLDLYRKVRGGTLRAKLVRDRSQIFRGSVQADNFTLLDEPRLAALLKPPTSSARQDRVTGEIRKLPAFRNNSAKVQRLKAGIEKGPGFLRISKGQMLGGDASAAFDGVVYDQRNRMNISGTFLPGRGLNKLVSNIPLLGLAFGSGKTTGLLGITFRLRGPYGNPRITVNPLSIIAPGVFRKLFQF